MELNKEFCIPSLEELICTKKQAWGPELINISQLNNTFNSNNAEVEEEIAKNLDDYIDVINAADSDKYR